MKRIQYEIKEIQVVPIKPQNGVVAFASFVLFDSIYCGSVAIVTRPQGGYRLLYPAKKLYGRSISVCHPIDKELGSAIEKVVIAKYEDVTKGQYDRYDYLMP